MLPAIALPAGLIGFGKSWWKAAVGAAVVAGPVFLVGQCSGAGHERHRAEAASAVAVAAATAKGAAANETAAGERLADQRQVAQLTEELTDAVAAVPDATPDPVAVALGCQRLRNAGRDVSDLPQCGGSAGGAQAHPRP